MANVSFFRHGPAQYQSMKMQCLLNPRVMYDPDRQIFPDLTEAGVALVRGRARHFFAGLDPRRDKISIGTSSQARAMESAAILLEVALELGFEVVKHQDPGNRLAEILGQGQILVVPELALDPNRSPLLGALFAKEGILEIDWRKVAPATGKLWDRARNLVDPNAGWGDNFFAHSMKVKELFFPELRSVYDLCQQEFRLILNLIKLALTTQGEKNVHTVLVGHEDYVAYFLNQGFGRHNIGYCEAIRFHIGNGRIIAGFDGKTITMERME